MAINDKQMNAYLIFKEVMRKNGIKMKLNQQQIKTANFIIEDALVDIEVAKKIVTERLFDQVATLFNIDNKVATLFLEDFGKALMSSSIKLKEAIDYDAEDYSPSFDFDFNIDDEEMDGVEDFDDEDAVREARKGRAPVLTGRAEKSRAGKAQVMTLLNKDPQFANAKQKLIAIANRLAKKYAREAGIQPNLVNVDKITVRQ